jgi:hypothetical protein
LEYAEEGDIANDDDEYAFGDDGDDEPLAESNEDDNDEYAKDGDIANNDEEYAVGETVSTSPLPRAATSTILSAPPAREHALRVSTRACPHAESIILSAGGA